MLRRGALGKSTEEAGEGNGQETRRAAAGNGGKQPGRTGAYGADPSGASANVSVSVSAGRTRVRTGRYHPGSYRPHLSRHTSPPSPRLAAPRRFCRQGRRLRSRARRRLAAGSVDAGVPSGGRRFSRRAEAEASCGAASRPARKRRYGREEGGGGRGARSGTVYPSGYGEPGCCVLVRARTAP